MGRGGYAPQQTNDTPNASTSDSDSDNDSDSDSSTVASEETIEEKEEVNLNERRTRRGVYLVLPEQQDDSDESEEETEQSTTVQGSTATSEAPPDEVPESPSKTISAIIDLTNSSPTSVSAPLRGLVARMRPSLATMKREAAERASSDVPVNKSIITTRAQKAREASLSSTPSRVRTASDSVDPPTSTASTPSRGLRSRTALANAADKSASCGPLGSSVSQGPSSNLPKRRGRPPKTSETVVVKVEEKDETEKLHPRPVRTRQSAPAVSATKPNLGAKDKAPEKPEKPELAIPCCMTCSTPLYSEPSTPQKKGKAKDVKEECSRWVV